MPPPDDDPLALREATTDRVAPRLDPTSTPGEYSIGIPPNPSSDTATFQSTSPGDTTPASMHPTVDDPDLHSGVDSTGSVSTAVYAIVAPVETGFTTPISNPISTDHAQHGGGAPMD